MSKFGKFTVRVKLAWKVLFLNKHRWILIEVKKEEFIKFLKDEDFEINYSYLASQPYINARIFTLLADQVDEVDMVLMKAEFQAKSEEYAARKK